MKNILLIIISLLSYHLLYSQSAQYEIVLFNDVIGKGDVRKTQLDQGITQLHLVSEAKAKVMFKERYSLTDVTIKMKDGIVIECTLIRKKEDEQQNVEIITENGTQFYIENGQKNKIAKSITYTTTHFFFQEPIGVKYAYVERLNEFVPIENLGNGLYKTKVDGADNYYQYKNGVLVEFRMKKGVNVYMNKV